MRRIKSTGAEEGAHTCRSKCQRRTDRSLLGAEAAKDDDKTSASMDECGSSHELDSHVLEAQSSIATGSHATSTMRNEAAGSEASPRPSDREKGPAPRSGRPTETGAPHPEKPQVEKTVPNKDGERETRKKTCCEKENLPDSFSSQSERAPSASEAPPLAKPATNRVGGRERATAAVCLCPAGANRRFALEFCLGLPSNVPPLPTLPFVRKKVATTTAKKGTSH